MDNASDLVQLSHLVARLGHAPVRLGGRRARLGTVTLRPMQRRAAPQVTGHANRAFRLGAAFTFTAALLLPLPAPAAAADVSVDIEARALLAGNVRPGSWAAVKVLISNDGPTVSGELRIRSSQQGRSRYGIEVELANGARQQFMLYAQPPAFGSRLHVDLVGSGGETLLTEEVPIKAHNAWSPTIGLVAERPEGIQPAMADLARNARQDEPASVITLTIDDLPERVEAWAAIDRLVWQDLDAAQLSSAQLQALSLWVGAGGQLVIVAGTAGIAPLQGFPDELLPFRPIQTIDVSPDEVATLIGRRPTDVDSITALSGALRAGTIVAGSSSDVIAAQLAVGQGSVTLLGINPAERWLAEGDASRTLWRRILPLGSGPVINPLSITDDSMIVYSLNNLPSVELPPIEQLFILLFAYVALIGPINYVVLRRLDRREWAWVTMPVLVAVFSVASYGLGAALKGSDVIVNQVAIVRAAQGTERGLGQVYVGIFSPSRRSFDVRVPEGALLSSPVSQFQFGQTEQPLDVLFGESTSRLRDFEVGFGVLRGFRAEAPADAPAIESDLRLVRGKLEGTVTNRSREKLEHVAVLFGGGVAVLSELGPDQTQTVSLDTTTAIDVWDYQVSERIFGSTFPRDRAEQRVVATRRTVVDQLWQGQGGGFTASAVKQPLLLAWHRGPALEVELAGERPNSVGDTLYMVPLAATVDRNAVFGDQMMAKTTLEVSGDGWAEGPSWYLGRGMMTVEARPVSFEGTLELASLEIAVTQWELRSLTGTGTRLEPLPDGEQPDQNDPMGDPPEPLREPRWEEPPALQLFDHAEALWLEFPALNSGRSYLIADPSRYVDSGGRLLARFVNRGALHEDKSFQFMVRLEGTIQ
jgi:hypothetical protein